MFPQRLRFHVSLLLAIAIRCCSGETIIDSTLNEALNFCCKTGLGLDSCSETRVNQTSHVPPTGICRTTMRLCCLYNPQVTKCEKNFVVNSFDRYCEKSSEKHETCCLACQLGQTLASEGKILNSRMMNDLLTNESIFELISDCYYLNKKKIFSRQVEKFLPLGQGLFYNTTSNTWDDIDECEIENNGCYQNQYCVNTHGSYSCVPRSICAENFVFDYVALVCKRKEGCNEVGTFTIREYPPPTPNEVTAPVYITIKNGQPKRKEIQDLIVMGSTTHNTTVKPTQCRHGYELNRQTMICEDIDECRTNRNKCQQDCRNFEGGFRCHCRRGYRVNPRDLLACIDIDECREYSNLCSHFCQNFQGSFRCACARGFKLGLDMKSCVDIDECSGKEKVCGNQVCKNLYGSYVCEQKCPDGYRNFKNFGRNFSKCIKQRCPQPIRKTCLNKANYLTYKNITLSGNFQTKKRRDILHTFRMSLYQFEPKFEMQVIPENCIDIRNLSITQKPTLTQITLSGSPCDARTCQIVVKVAKSDDRVVEVLTIDLTFIGKI